MELWIYVTFWTIAHLEQSAPAGAEEQHGGPLRGAPLESSEGPGPVLQARAGHKWGRSTDFQAHSAEVIDVASGLVRERKILKNLYSLPGKLFLLL